MNSKFKKFSICLIFILLVFYGVQRFKSSNSEEYKFIQKEIIGSSDQINLTNFNSFEWSGITIYPPYARITNIQKETSISFSTMEKYSEFGSLKEGVSLIVFWNNEKVVSHIFFPRNEFDFSDFSQKGLIKKADAIFEKKK